jgi:hypothetical protein
MDHNLGTVVASKVAAREWAQQGVTGITIVNPQGESYDIDGFGMIVSTTEEGANADRT